MGHGYTPAAPQTTRPTLGTLRKHAIVTVINMSLLVINARLITVPAGIDDPGYIERGYMLVQDGRIAAIGAGDPDPGVTADEILDVDGKFVAPGFVSSHSHLFTSGSRGLGVDQTLYGWCTSMFSVLDNASPDQIYWATLHGSLDFLANGVTTAYNFTDPLLPWEPMVEGKRADGGGILRDHAWHTWAPTTRSSPGSRPRSTTCSRWIPTSRSARRSWGRCSGRPGPTPPRSRSPSWTASASPTRRTSSRRTRRPASNGRLASGIAHVPEMLEQGMKVGMGLDDQACTDVADPWQNMRMGMFMQRARTHDPLSMMPERVLRLHTLGGAEIMGVDDRVGSLEVGKFADFVVVDPRKPDVGPLWNPVRSYVLACGLRNLTQVYVGGKLVNENGLSTNPLAEEASRVLHEELPALAEEFGVIL
ncbi:MAG: cytosine deaminase [Microbacterium sp.]|nr:cytosine deaminase [Microbacterium sp.]